MRLLTSVTLAICLFVVCNQASSNNEDTSEMTLPTYTSIQAQQGKVLYQKSCIACHGANLDNGYLRCPLVMPMKISNISVITGDKNEQSRLDPAVKDTYPHDINSTVWVFELP